MEQELLDKLALHMNGVDVARQQGDYSAVSDHLERLMATARFYLEYVALLTAFRGAITT